MTTNQPIEIALSERSPVKIDPDIWPVIASAEGQSAEPARTLIVRAHADGRRIVYGTRTGPEPRSAGFLVDATSPSAETVRAIRRVAGIIGDRQLGDDCMNRLPAEELT